MSPFQIDVLLHYYTRPGDHAACVNNAPIWRDTIDEFLKDGLMEMAGAAYNGSTYVLTQRGTYYVEHGLCRVPLPVQRWEIPATEAKS